MSTPTLASEADRGTRAADFRRLLEEFRNRLDEELTAFLAEKRKLFEAGAGGVELVEAVEELVLSGGKRLRPALVDHTYRACGGDAERVVFDLDMSVELLHSYLLIHDDIMDHAEVRRGRPATHVAFSERHRQFGWRGEPLHFGSSVAILVGDLAHTWAIELFDRARETESEAGDGRVDWAVLERAFSRMCEEVVQGQYLEILMPHRSDPSEEELLEVLRLKSGSYTVERPIQFGAALAGAPAETRENLGRYGVAVGEAFQMRDDVLGVFGDVERVGKSVESDLVEGKRTVLVHHALRRAPEGDARRLREILEAREPSSDEIEEARRIIRSSGGLEVVLEMIDDRLEAALQALADEELTPDGRRFFEGLVDYLRERER